MVLVRLFFLECLACLDFPEKGEVLYRLGSEDSDDNSKDNNSEDKNDLDNKSTDKKEKYIDEGVWVDLDDPGINRMKVRRKIGFMYQEFALQHHSTIKDQLATKLGFKNEFVVDEARKKAKELELGDELLDALYQLTDLPENEAKSRLEQIGLSPDILDDCFLNFLKKLLKRKLSQYSMH